MLPDWHRSFPDCEPIAPDLRHAFPDRWVRFHSLPESKRYPDDGDEFATLLARHNLVLGSLTEAGETLVLLTTGYSDTPDPVRDDDLAALDPEAVAWRTVPRHELGGDFGVPTYWHLFASRHSWLPGGFDPIVRRVAEDAVANVMIVPPDCRWLLHLYDGGMDVILESRDARNALSASYHEWLSPRADGA